MGDIEIFFTLDHQPPPSMMLTAQELKKAHEELDAQIAVAEQAEREAKEAWVTAEKAHLEEEEGVRKLAQEAEEAQVWAEEEAWRQEGERCVREEEDCLAVERDLREEGGPSRERAPRRRLFLPLSDSAGSLEEEEEVMAGPSQDKGKGHAPVPEEVRGEVTGVVCDLCDKQGIPCRWGKVRTC